VPLDPWQHPYVYQYPFKNNDFLSSPMAKTASQADRTRMLICPTEVGKGGLP